MPWCNLYSPERGVVSLAVIWFGCNSPERGVDWQVWANWYRDTGCWVVQGRNCHCGSGWCVGGCKCLCGSEWCVDVCKAAKRCPTQ